MTIYTWIGGPLDIASSWQISDPNFPYGPITPQTPPGSGDIATVDGGGILTGGDGDIGTFEAVGAFSLAGPLTVGIASFSGSLNLSASATIDATRLFINSVFTGTGADLTVSQDLDIGDGDQGSLSLSDSTIQSDRFFVGGGAGDQGSVTLSSTDLVDSADSQIGDAGTGSLLLNKDSSFETQELTIGNVAGGQGNVIVDASTLTTSGFLLVGVGGTGSLTAQNGATVSAGSFSVGIGSFQFNSGANVSAGAFNVGTVTSAVGSGVIDGATVNVGNYINVGDAGSGFVTIQNGALVSANGFDIAGEPAGSGGVLVDSATVDVNSDFTVGGAGPGFLTIQDKAVVSAGGFAIGDNSKGSGAFLFKTGANVSAVLFDLGIQSSAVGSGVIDGATVDVGSDFYVGDAGSGLLTIQDKAVVSAGGFTIGNESTGSGGLTIQTGANVSAGYIDFAYQSSATAVALFDNATVNVSNFIVVGDAGSAGITIQNGATVSAGGIVVGNQSGGSGGLKVQNGTTLSAGVLYLGTASGANGLATFDSATVNVSGYLTVGIGGSGGVLVQDGAQVTAGGLTLGYQSGSFGSLTVSGSNTDVTVDPNDDTTSGTVIGYQGSGTLLVTHGATFDPGSFIALGYATGGAGDLDIDRGIGVETDNIGIGGSPAGSGGAGTINVAQGGTVTADQTIGLFSGTINVANGGSVDIGTKTDSIAGAVHAGAHGTFTQLPGKGTISGNLVDDGNVSVYGTLNVTGSTTIDNGGTLTVYDGGSVNGIIVDNGGLVFDVTSTDTFNGTLTGSGSVIVEGGGTLVLGGGDAFTGLTTISAGTLEVTSATAAGSGSITFGPAGGETLQIDGSTMPTNVISGFAVGDTIDLAGASYVNYLSGGGVADLYDDNVLNVTENNQTYQLDLDLTQDFTGQTFILSPDGNGGTDVTLATDPSLLDYLEFSDLAYDLTPSGFVFSSPAKFPSLGKIPTNWGLTGWSELTSTIDFESTGLTAVVFVDKTSTDPTYDDAVISFRGSVTAHDWLVSDVQLATGFAPPEFSAALAYVQQLETTYSSQRYSYFVTGHSLGGAEAEVVAATTGLGGVVFAAPGVGNELGKGDTHDGANLTDYVIADDPVGNYTKLSGPYIGNEITLPAYTLGYSSNSFLGGLLGAIKGVTTLGVSAFLDHTISSYGEALANQGLIPFNPFADPSNVFGDLSAIYPNITNVTAQTDGSGDVTESGTVDATTSTGTAVATISETATTAGVTTFSVTINSGQETASQIAQMTSAGVISDQIVLNGLDVSTPLSEPADLNVAPDGSLLVGTSSPTQGDEITIDGLANGSDEIFVGGDTVDPPVEVADLSTQGLSGSTLDVSASGNESVTYDLQVASGDTANGSVLSSGGTLTIDAGGTLEGVTTLADGGTEILDAGSSISSGASFHWSGTGATLQIDGPQSAGRLLSGTTISGFTEGDTIDFTGIAYDPDYTIGLVGSDELQFTENGTTYELQLAGDYTGQTFYLSPDNSDPGTDITDVPCYCSGTLIETMPGQGLVEELRVGDEVITASGEARLIKWIGKRSYSGSFVMGRKDILPICVKAGALDRMCRGATFGFRRTMPCISMGC